MYARRQPLRVRSSEYSRLNRRIRFSEIREEVKALSNMAYLLREDLDRRESQVVPLTKSIRSSKLN